MIQLQANEFIGSSKEAMAEILKAGRTHNQIEIIAPTGSGKTFFIDNILAKKTDAVIVVPFKIINQVYKNSKTIDTNSTEDDLIDGPMVMVIDQAVRFWEQIKYRTIIIDEAHCLMTEVTYRDKVIQFVKLLNERIVKGYQSKVIAFTATPCIESKMLSMHVVEIRKDRKRISTTFIKVKSVAGCMAHRCLDAMTNLNISKIFVMDNSHAKSIYEKLRCRVPEECLDYLRSETINTEECQKIVQDEMLNKIVTVSTKVACNGLNFNNEHENILIITSFHPGRTSYMDIIQMIGRIRKTSCNIAVEIYYNENTLFEAHIQRSLIKDAVTAEEVSYNEEYKLYFEKHSCNIDAIIKDLGSYEYIYVTKDFINKTVKMSSSKHSDGFKDWIRSNSNWIYEIDTITDEHPEWDKYICVIKDLSYGFGFSEFEIARNIRALCKQSKACMDVILNRYRLWVEVCSMTDEEYDRFIYLLKERICRIKRNKEGYCKVFNNNNYIKIAMLMNQNEKELELAMKYRELSKVSNTLDVIENTKKVSCSKAGKAGNTVGKSNGGKIGGKKGSPKKQVIIERISNGESITFSSKGECMTFLGIGEGLFSRWIKGVPTKSKALKDYRVVSVG